MGKQDNKKKAMSRRDFMKLTSAGLAGLALPLGFGGYFTPFSKHDKVLLKNVNIVDVRTGAIRKENQILLQNGKILGLFSRSESISANHVQDCQNTYLSPGLINANCYMSAPGRIINVEEFVSNGSSPAALHAEACIDHGVTTVRDAGALSSWVRNVKDDIDQGAIKGPRIIPSCLIEVPSGYLSGYCAASPDLDYHNLLPSLDTHSLSAVKSAARSAVQSAANAGMKWIKLTHQEDLGIECCMGGGRYASWPVFPQTHDCSIVKINREVAKAICDEASKCGISVMIHNTEISGLNTALYAGVNTVERVVANDYISRKQINDLVNKGIYVVPSNTAGFAGTYETNIDPWVDIRCSGQDGTSYSDISNIEKWYRRKIKEDRQQLMLDIINEFSDPLFAAGLAFNYNKYETPDYWDTRSFMDVSINNDSTQGYLTKAQTNLHNLFNAGVPFGCGNDGGMPLAFPGAMALEMFLLERASFNRADVLKMATLNNAQMLGFNDLGAIEQGMIADMVIYQKNPLDTNIDALDNLNNTLNPLVVFRDGMRVGPA